MSNTNKGYVECSQEFRCAEVSTDTVQIRCSEKGKLYLEVNSLNRGHRITVILSPKDALQFSADFIEAIKFVSGNQP